MTLLYSQSKNYFNNIFLEPAAKPKLFWLGSTRECSIALWPIVGVEPREEEKKGYQGKCHPETNHDAHSQEWARLGAIPTAGVPRPLRSHRLSGAAPLLSGGTLVCVGWHTMTNGYAQSSQVGRSLLLPPSCFITGLPS